MAGKGTAVIALALGALLLSGCGAIGKTKAEPERGNLPFPIATKAPGEEIKEGAPAYCTPLLDAIKLSVTLPSLPEEEQEGAITRYGQLLNDAATQASPGIKTWIEAVARAASAEEASQDDIAVVFGPEYARASVTVQDECGYPLAQFTNPRKALNSETPSPSATPSTAAPSASATQASTAYQPVTIKEGAPEYCGAVAPVANKGREFGLGSEITSEQAAEYAALFGTAAPSVPESMTEAFTVSARVWQATATGQARSEEDMSWLFANLGPVEQQLESECGFTLTPPTS